MKKYITLFIIAQLLDILTTVVAYYFMGFTELNPLINSLSMVELIGFKILMIIFVTFVLIELPKRKIYNIFWIVSLLPVLWNILNIIVEVI